MKLRKKALRDFMTVAKNNLEEWQGPPGVSEGKSALTPLYITGFAFERGHST